MSIPAPSPVRESPPIAPRCAEVLENCDPVRDDLMVFLAIDIYDKSDATAVMLVKRIVKSLLFHQIGPCA